MTRNDGDHLDRAAWYLVTAQPVGLDDRERERLAPVRAALAATYTWVAPAPELVDEVLAELDLPPPRRASRPRRARPLLAGAAAVAALALAVVGVWGRPDRDGGDATRVALVGTDLAPAASAVATVHETSSGTAISLDVEGLAPAPTGFFYQAWVNGPSGAVAVGTFHVRGGDEEIELWSGVDSEAYPELTVTIEPEDGDPTSSRQRVLTGE